MKDGSDVITGCSDDGKTLLPVPSITDSVCSENGPSGSLGLHKDRDADTFSPETTNTWGDFESFNEFTPRADQLIYENGPLDEDIHDGEDYPDSKDEESQWDAFNLGNEDRQECDRIFRLSFPAVPVEDTSEDVKSLQALLTSSSEENLSTLIKTRLWLECDSSWQNIDSTCTKSGCEWPKSKGCRDLMTLLGSTTDKNAPLQQLQHCRPLASSCRFAESSVAGGKTENAFTDIEQLHVNDCAPPAGNKYLIQTKMDVAPGSKSGHIFPYQLVLKKSQSEVSLPFLAFMGKKSFFSANQLRFNF